MVDLSVVIRTFNRKERLRACLSALARQSASPGTFEVVVVVDGSTDGTLEMLEDLSPPFALRAVHQENQGAHLALNRGIREARGRFCLFLDDDIIAEPELVAEHLRVQQERGGVVGIGRLTMLLPEGADWFVRAYTRSWTDHYEALNREAREPDWTDCFAGNLSVPRSNLLAIGGAAADLPRSHDVELGYRLRKAGLEFCYIPGALGHQDEEKRFSTLTADFERSGAGWVRILERHPEVLPELFGSYHHTRWLSIALQHASLAASVPPSVLRFLVGVTGKRDYRAFHFLRNYCYWRGVKRAVADRDTWKRLTSPTRILMYHAFGEGGGTRGRFVVSIGRLSRQIGWLRRLGFSPIGLEEYLACRREHRLPPARSVIVTIDDGYADVLSLAMPVLRAGEFPATVFVVSSRIGGRNDWSQEEDLRGRALVSRSDIRDLVEAGLSIGAHTRTHPDLTGLTAFAARDEIAGSKHDLEEELGVPVRTFAHPYGARTPETERMAEEAGFLGSCGVEEGINHPRTPLHALNRIEIFGSDGLIRFLAKVWLGQTYLPRIRPVPRSRSRGVEATGG